jgi:hypothetical protein
MQLLIYIDPYCRRNIVFVELQTEAFSFIAAIYFYSNEDFVAILVFFLLLPVTRKVSLLQGFL